MSVIADLLREMSGRDTPGTPETDGPIRKGVFVSQAGSTAIVTVRGADVPCVAFEHVSATAGETVFVYVQGPVLFMLGVVAGQ